MRLYAEMRRVRARQLLQDMAVVLWIVLWVVVGFKMNALVNELVEPGETIERAGSGFAGSVEEIGGGVGDVPLVGEELRRPFEAVAGAGRWRRPGRPSRTSCKRSRCGLECCSP